MSSLNQQPPAQTQSSQPSNPTVVAPVSGDEGPTTKDTRTVEQRLADLRDILMKKYPKGGPVTVRLDVTDVTPGMEYLAISGGIPDLPGQTKRYGVLRSETVRGLSDLIASLP